MPLAADMATALPYTSHLHDSQPTGEIASLRDSRNAISFLTRIRQIQTTPARCLQKERPTAARWSCWATVWPVVGEGVRQMRCVPSGLIHFGDVR
eukprot:CAMPEP_0204186618 /NCGR_PEP_ID=MMETSP0361-20130328/56151_1 /ASSEMBLY_ACC=CAM_ASM_000343 /TAXON_ID=268821 /ORGANISM="Scrippsiella Hangoei, Strain SHTV-5" /LENGTH=94 /DNA_ID=CAMNT_0051146937 /DNA_START=321 /DNA_END=601 /DNA_ORIENTATION=-